MKNRIKTIIKVFALAAVIIVAYFFISKHATDFAILKTISPRLVFLLAFIYAVEIILNSVLFSLLINSFSKKVKPFECFSLTAVHRLANYLVSQGGALTRAYYLKK